MLVLQGVDELMGVGPLGRRIEQRAIVDDHKLGRFRVIEAKDTLTLQRFHGCAQVIITPQEIERAQLQHVGPRLFRRYIGGQIAFDAHPQLLAAEDDRLNRLQQSQAAQLADVGFHHGADVGIAGFDVG